MQKERISNQINFFINVSFLIFLIIFIKSSPSLSQVYIGYNSGINLSGTQDHKFRQYNLQNQMITDYKTKDIDGIFSLVNNFYITAWGNGNHFANYGIRLEFLSWNLTTMVDEFPADVAPPFNTIEQERNALILNVLKRVSFPRLSNYITLPNEFFMGFGGGIIHSEVQHGVQGYGVGIQLIGGFSVPLNHNLSMQFQSRYFLAPDVDAWPKPGWRVDTSGTHTFLRFDNHLDTSFLGFLVGFEWKLNR